MGASKPATYGRFKTSHQFQGFAFPFSLYPPSFPVQSIRNRLGFLFPPEARASRRHNIPADDRSPGCESHPDRLKPPPRQGPPSRGVLWLVLNPRARLRAIRSTLKTTTVLTVPAKMEVCKEPDHVGLGHLAHGVAGQPLQGEQPGGQLVRRQPIADPAAQLLQREPSRAPAPRRRRSARPTPGRAGPPPPPPGPPGVPQSPPRPPGRRPLPAGGRGSLAKPDSFENTASICAGSGLRELLLFSCHSLFITNHVLSSMT